MSSPPSTASSGAPSLDGRWVTALLLTALLFAVSNAALISGSRMGIWDVDGQFRAYFTLVADHAAAGRFVSWDPWTNGGLPMAGDPQLGAFSPVVVALGLLSGGSTAGFIAYWLLLWWLGGVGVLLLARHLGAPAWGAAIVALGFLFCGVYASNAEHTPIVSAFSFAPWILWRLDVALLRGGVRPAVEAGALWGLSALAGHPSVVVIVAGWCAIWATGRALARRAGAMHATTCVLLVAVVGLIVLAPTYLSFLLDGVGVHGRVGALDRDVALTNQFDPRAVVTLASAYATRAKWYDQSLFPSSDISMTSIHAGALIPLLALAALATARDSRWRWWLLGTGLLSLAAAMGESLPVRGWIYDLLPPTRYFRHSGVFRVGFVIALTALAIEGARELHRALAGGDDRQYWRIALAAVAGAVALVALQGAFLVTMRAHPLNAPLALIAVGPAAAAAAVFLLGAMLRADRRRIVLPVLLVLVAGGDALLARALSARTIMDEGQTAERWQRLSAAHVRSLDLTRTGWRRDLTACPGWWEHVKCRQNDQYVTKIPVYEAYATARNPLHEASTRHSVLRSAATGDDRVWFSADVVTLPPLARHHAQFAERATELGAPPIVVHAPDQMRRGSADSAAAAAAAPRTDDAPEPVTSLPPAQRVSATLRAYAPRRLAFDVAAPSDGWLLVTDRWAPGWRAWVDGAEVPVHGGNFIFRAIPLSGGAHTIEFRYASPVEWLVWPSWLMLAAVAALAALREPRRLWRRSSAGAGSPGSGR